METSNPIRGDPPGRYAPHPFEMPRKAWWQVTKRVWRTFVASDIMLKCAGTAFYGVLSLFPAVAIGVFVYGLLADPANLGTHLSVLRELFPSTAYTLFEERLTALVTASEEGLGLGLVISLLFAIWTGSLGVNALIDVIGHNYKQADRRNLVTRTLMSIGMTFAIMLFFTLNIVLAGAVPLLLEAYDAPDGAVAAVRWSRWVILFGMMLAVIAFIYRHAPDRRDARMRWIWPGAVFASAFFILSSIAFSFYVENATYYDAMFGSISTAIVLLLWFYYSAIIVAVGAELNAQLELQTIIDTTVGPGRPRGMRGAYVADHVYEEVDEASET